LPLSRLHRGFANNPRVIIHRTLRQATPQGHKGVPEIAEDRLETGQPPPRSCVTLKPSRSNPRDGSSQNMAEVTCCSRTPPILLYVRAISTPPSFPLPDRDPPWALPSLDAGLPSQEVSLRAGSFLPGMGSSSTWFISLFTCPGLWFVVWGLGFGVSGFGLRVSGFGIRGSGFGSRV